MEKIVRQEDKKEFEERIIEINRISRTVAGGRRIRFRAAVVIGDKKGRVGVGVAKGTEVILAVQKAIAKARKNLISVPIVDGTVPHQVEAKFGAARLLIKPARPGTGVIAGGPVRSIAELAGIENIVSKLLGSQNKINNLKATIIALKSLKMKNLKLKIKETKMEKKSEVKRVEKSHN